MEESKKFIPENEQDRIVPIWIGSIRDKIKEEANDALPRDDLENPLVSIDLDSIPLAIRSFEEITPPETRTNLATTLIKQ